MNKQNQSPPTVRQAVALTYDGQRAPTLSAKGEDQLAERILATAREHEVPIYEHAELTQLLAQLELGDAIPENLYLCIAEILAFAWYLKGKCPTGFHAQPKPSEKIAPSLPQQNKEARATEGGD